jgi:hypothetical protein
MATSIPKTTSDTIRDLRKQKAEKAKTPRATKTPSVQSPGVQPTNPKGNEAKAPQGAAPVATGDIVGTITASADLVRSGILTEAPNFSQWKVSDYSTVSSSIGETDLKAGEKMLEQIERQRATAAIVKANQGLQTDLNQGATDAGKLLSTAAAAATSLEGVNTGLEKYRQNLEKTQLEAARADNIKIEGDGTKNLADAIRQLQTAKQAKLISQVQKIEAEAQRFLATPIQQTVDVQSTDM